MSRRKLTRMAHLGFWVALAVSGSAPAYAKEKHTANVQVLNKTGKDIQFVTVASKYSDNYKNAKTWGNLPDGADEGSPRRRIQHGRPDHRQGLVGRDVEIQGRSGDLHHRSS